MASKDKAGLPYALNICAFTPDVPFCADPHDHITVLCGYLKRIAPQQVQETLETSEEIENLSHFVTDFLGKLQTKYHIEPLPKITEPRSYFESWLNETKNYNDNRKNQLRKTFNQYMNNGQNLTYRDYNCKSFIKREFYEEPKFPRLINSRTDIFKVSIAPYIHNIEKQMYKLKWFVKHNTPQEIASKFQHINKYNYFLETDYSSFESCFSNKYCDAVELQLFYYFFQNNLDIYYQILQCYYHGDKNRITKLKNEEYIAYASECRFSGEMWTSLGNGFSNLMNMLYLCEKYDIKAKGLVEGDDAIFCLNKNIIKPQDYEKLGFRIKMKYEKNIINTTFCGITYDSENNRLLAPPEQIARMGWTCHAQYLNSRQKILLGLLKAKAMSVYSTTPCTPILGPLAFKIIQLTLSIQALENTVYHKWIIKFEKTFRYQEIRMSTRILYSEKYGISLAQQEVCENIIRDAKTLQDIQLPFYFLEHVNTAQLW